MITVAMGTQTTDNERTWFDRTVAAEFDYNSAYSKLEWSLRPRWGGSHAAMLALGQECADTKRYDTGVPRRQLSALKAVYRELVDDKRTQAIEALFADQELWASLKVVLDQTINMPDITPKNTKYYRSTRAALAWRFGDRDAAAKEVHELRDGVDDKVLATFNLTVDTILKDYTPDPDAVDPDDEGIDAF